MYLNFVNTDNNNIYITNQLFMSSDAHSLTCIGVGAIQFQITQTKKIQKD